MPNFVYFREFFSMEIDHTAECHKKLHPVCASAVEEP